MTVVTDIYGLIRDLLTEAEKAKNDILYSKLIDIKKQVDVLDEENKALKKQLEIKENMVYSDDAKSFSLPSNPNIHYCSTCYGYSGKLIPMANGNSGLFCRICEEIWFKNGRR